MEFAFKTSPQNTTYADMLAVWKAADEMEVFESGWTFDHFYPIFSDSTGPCMEGWTVTTALAQATSRLRLGLLVTGIHYRHPAVLANMAATLDIISEGRLELGIGAGWNEEESGAYGIELGTLKERFDRFDEACEVLVGLLTQETTTFTGDYFTLTEARNEPKPVQRPHPPIVIGGTGEKRTLRTVAKYAQHWNHPGRRSRTGRRSSTSCTSGARRSDAILRRSACPRTSATTPTTARAHWPIRQRRSPRPAWTSASSTSRHRTPRPPSNPSPRRSPRSRDT
jgi:F420-dependent oxidoreductase-like protein